MTTLAKWPVVVQQLWTGGLPGYHVTLDALEYESRRRHSLARLLVLDAEFSHGSTMAQLLVQCWRERLDPDVCGAGLGPTLHGRCAEPWLRWHLANYVDDYWGQTCDFLDENGAVLGEVGRAWLFAVFWGAFEAERRSRRDAGLPAVPVGLVRALEIVRAAPTPVDDATWARAIACIDLDAKAPP